MIDRLLISNLEESLFKGKAIILLGSRQTGKTTIIKKLVSSKENILWLNGDEPDVRDLLENVTSTKLKAIFGKNKIIIIDEAQRIKEIGITLKLITDEIPDVQLIASGSSAFDLASETSEALTGRKIEYHLYPFSFAELSNHHGVIEEKRMLSHRLIYGSYPDVINNAGDEKEVLKQLSDSYLYKDLLMMSGIKRPEQLVKLLKALALQVGSEVSYNEIANLIGLDNQVVEKYISLLEKVYVIFRLPALKRNLRNELKKGKKIYFYDNGIMNALNAQFANVESRRDIGSLWENYLIAERQKKIAYNKMWVNKYFWRTHEQQEIDYLEEADGIIHAFEFKWNPKSKVKFSKTFLKAYPEHKLSSIHRDNYEEFLL